MTTPRTLWLGLAALALAGCDKAIPLDNCPAGTQCTGRDGTGPDGGHGDLDADSSFCSGPGSGSYPLADAGSATYVVTSVSGSGSDCFGLPGGVFAQAGDTVTIDFEQNDVWLDAGASSAASTDLSDCERWHQNLDGTTDLTMANWQTPTAYYYTDNRYASPSSIELVAWYELLLTQTGDTVEVDLMTSSAQSDATCVLTKQ